MKQLIPCKTCKGRGTEWLPAHLDETLYLLRVPRTATELSVLVPSATANAFSNRLSKLMALGLVSRKREGKSWRYSKIKTK